VGSGQPQGTLACTPKRFDSFDYFSFLANKPFAFNSFEKQRQPRTVRSLLTRPNPGFPAVLLSHHDGNISAFALV
jgi:hypothetical protein